MKKIAIALLILGLMATHSLAQAAPTITVNLTAGTNATSHRIEKKVDSGTYATLVTLNMPTVSYTDTAVSLGHLYTYRSIAINSLQESAPSNECSSPLFAPGVPTNFTCTVNP